MGLDVYVGSQTRYHAEGPAAGLGRVQPGPLCHRQAGLDGYGGALLLAAHDEHPELPPPGRGLRRLARRPRLPGRLGRGAGSRYARLLTPELWLPCRFEFTARTPGADGHSLSAAAGNGLAVLLRLAARSVSDRVPMKLDF